MSQSLKCHKQKIPNEKAICKQKEQELSNLWKFESCMLFQNYLIFNLCWTVQKWFGLVLVSFFFYHKIKIKTKSSRFDLYSIFQNAIVSKTKYAPSEIIWFHCALATAEQGRTLLKVYIFWEGQKFLRNLHHRFLSKPKRNKPETFNALIFAK